MKKLPVILSAGLLLCFTSFPCLGKKDKNSLLFKSTEDWKSNAQKIEGLSVDKGMLAPTGDSGVYRSKLVNFSSKKAAKSIHLSCSPLWENWEAIPESSTPSSG